MSRSILFTFLIFCQLVFLPILLLLLLQFLLLSGSWLPFACFATSHPNKFCPNSFSLYRPAPSFFFVPAPAHFNQTTVLLTAPHSAPACSFHYSTKRCGQINPLVSRWNKQLLLNLISFLIVWVYRILSLLFSLEGQGRIC